MSSALEPGGSLGPAGAVPAGTSGGGAFSFVPAWWPGVPSSTPALLASSSAALRPLRVECEVERSLRAGVRRGVRSAVPSSTPALLASGSAALRPLRVEFEVERSLGAGVRRGMSSAPKAGGSLGPAGASAGPAGGSVGPVGSSSGGTAAAALGVGGGGTFTSSRGSTVAWPSTGKSAKTPGGADSVVIGGTWSRASSNKACSSWRVSRQ